MEMPMIMIIIMMQQYGHIRWSGAPVQWPTVNWDPIYSLESWFHCQKLSVYSLVGQLLATAEHSQSERHNVFEVDWDPVRTLRAECM